MDKPEELIAKAVDGNRRLRLEMFEAIASEQAVSFVGAGLSTKLKYPDWNGLIGQLSERATLLAPFTATSEDTLLVAEQIKQHFVSHRQEDEYYDILARTFDTQRPRCTDTHLHLARLPFRLFVTTNYDPCLEHALCAYALEEKTVGRPDCGVIIAAERRNRSAISKLMRSLATKFQKLERSVAYLHGRYTDPKTIVLTLADYEEAYGVSLRPRETQFLEVFTIHRRIMWSLLTTRRLVFIGCSMKDPYLMRLLKIVTEDMWEWEAGNHFVIVGLDQSNISLVPKINHDFGRFGITPVYFDNFDESYSHLDSLLEEARGLCHADLPRGHGVPDAAPTTSGGSVDASPPDQSPRIPFKTTADWLADLGERNLKRIVNDED